MRSVSGILKLAMLALLLCASPARAVITVAQEVAHLDQPSENPDSVAITGATAGNVLVVVVWGYASNRSMSSITDDASNTYVEDHESINGVGFAFYSSLLATGGNLTLTINFNATSGGHHVYIYELSTSTSWPTPHFDAGVAAVSSAGVSSVATGNFTTAQDNEFILGVLSLGNSRDATFSAPANAVEDIGGTSLREIVHSLTNTASSTQTAAASWSGGNTTGRICAAAYKDTAAAAPMARRPPVVWH